MYQKNKKTTNPKKTVISRALDGKIFLWLSGLNKYIVTEHPFDRIIEQVYTGKNLKQIQDYCMVEFGYTEKNANLTIQKIKLSLEEIQKEANRNEHKRPRKLSSIPETFNYRRYYLINDSLFLFEFENAKIEYLIHPKLAHLEIKETAEFNHHFQVFKTGTELSLVINGQITGSWPKEMEHFMTGKVSMEILQKIYGNQENDWMAVFHASAISDENKCILFLGDSGNGKSTTAAILMSNDLHLVADDFVPVDAQRGNVFNFPAALSVKKKALDLLIPFYPQLELAKEFTYAGMDKTVRYLPALSQTEKFPCKALIFVKYKSDAGFMFGQITKEEAFRQLIPDSWISPLPANASFFLDWFSELPCYQMTYSNNQKMVTAIKNMFRNEI